MPSPELAAHLVADVLGYDGLRPGQGEAIQAVLSGRDTLAILATGSGKSAIYQACAAALPGPTVVVSPLIALQRDQVGALRDMDAGDAVRIDSTMTTVHRRRALDDLEAGNVEFVFASPEQLHNAETLAAVVDAAPSLVVIDEAHCISEWGHDFRPAYRDLGALIDRLGHPVVLALTATAAPPVRDDIIGELHMREPAVVVRGFDRPNIHLSVQRHDDADDRDAAVIELARSLPGQGIVYAGTRRRVEEFAAALAPDRSVAYYHGALGRADRDAAHRRFSGDEVEIMVATNAFGMGIDKEDVRWIVHAEVPASLDEYYQEVGRAGRDGQPARAVLCYRPADIGRQRYRAARGRAEQLELAKSRLEMLRTYCETRSCRRALVLSYLGQPFEGSCHRCDCCDRDAGAGLETRSHPFRPGQRVRHRAFGDGSVMSVRADDVTVLFDTVGYRNLSIELVLDEHLLELDPVGSPTAG